MFTPSVNINSYLAETISYQLEKSNDPKYYDYLQYASSGNESIRESLLIWVTDLCTDLKLCISTGHLACYYLDRFLSRRPTVQRQIYELIGVIALVAASKFKEGLSFSPEKIQNMLGNRFSIDAIITTERYMMETLEWELCHVTACDLIETLCEFTFGENVTKRILDTAFSIATLSYTSLQLAHVGSYNIAVSSIYLTLKRLGHRNIMDDWLRTLGEDLQIEEEKLRIVIENVENRLESFRVM